MVVLSTSVEENRRPCPKLTSKVVSIPLDPIYLERTVQLRKDLYPMMRDEIIQLLGRYMLVFAFNTLEMLGIAPKVIEHKLSVDLNLKLVI